MTDAARRTYRRFARFFLIIGAVFLGLGVLRASVAPDVLRGNPVPVALLLLAIGGTLRWTVRVRVGEEGADDETTVEEGRDADALGSPRDAGSADGTSPEEAAPDVDPGRPPRPGG
ncbi:MAG: hypothetical protein GVY27_08825 [Deinococcus-Thermus bacterium]|nr:hypothetical protein [Deinococcota bacterium]